MDSKKQLILGLKKLKAYIKAYDLNFKQAAKTSRDTLLTKKSWFLVIYDENEPNIKGIGECSPIWGLSVEDSEINFEAQLKQVCDNINDFKSMLVSDALNHFPAIRFGLETALLDLYARGSKNLFPSDFSLGKKGQKINGLIWMGEFDEMKVQIEEKVAQGFDCIKLKVGGIAFEEEMELLHFIRKNYAEQNIELRLDANGAFADENAKYKLEQLSKYNIHSIEQPIKAGNTEQMKKLCASAPIAIALDEELIGIQTAEQEKLIKDINPKYLVLKPTLLGGFKATENWIKIAEAQNIKWWVTSALESNIGLNAIAQWTFQFNNNLPQGFGTGQLFSNNILSPLYIDNGYLNLNSEAFWDLCNINQTEQLCI